MQTNTLLRGACLILAILVLIPVLAFIEAQVDARREVAEDKRLMADTISAQLDSQRFLATNLKVLSQTTTSRAREYTIEARIFAAGVTRVAGRVTGKIGIALDGDKRVAYDYLSFEYNDFGRKLLETTTVNH